MEDNTVLPVHIIKQQNWTSFETWLVLKITRFSPYAKHLIQDTALSASVFLLSAKLDSQGAFPINMILAHPYTFLQREPSKYYACAWGCHIKITFTFLRTIQSKTFVFFNLVHEHKSKDELSGLNPATHPVEKSNSSWCHSRPKEEHFLPYHSVGARAIHGYIHNFPVMISQGCGRLVLDQETDHVTLLWPCSQQGVSIKSTDKTKCIFYSRGEIINGNYNTMCKSTWKMGFITWHIYIQMSLISF